MIELLMAAYISCSLYNLINMLRVEVLADDFIMTDQCAKERVLRR